MTDLFNIDWLLDCEPRIVQLEALSRSYRGWSVMQDKDTVRDEPIPLQHKNVPAPGYGFFMEMRLGKTPTLLNEYMLFKRDYGIKRALVLAPNRYKHTWAAEAEKFGVDVPVHVFESGYKDAFSRWKQRSGGEGMVFVNYEALNSAPNFAALKDWVDDRTYMGADESALIKNHTSGMFKRAFELSKIAAVARPMSGLPAPQSVADLWSQLRFGKRLNGVNYFAFRNTYAVMGGFKGRQIVGIRNRDRLNDLMFQCGFKALRANWGLRIESDYETVRVDMTPEQRTAYTRMENEFVLWLDSGAMVTADNVVVGHMKLQQISSGFVITGDGDPVDIMPMEKTPKFVDMMARIDNEIDGKILIIAHYRHTIDRLLRVLGPRRPALIAGVDQMKKYGKDVEAEKARFNTDPNCRILIGQSAAIRYGHTLMGSATDPCHTMFFFENAYSLDIRKQSEERPQGFGQTAGIYIVDYASAPIDVKIINCLKNKQRVSDVIMSHYKHDYKG